MKVVPVTREEREAIAYLRSPRTIRERCQQLLDRAQNNRLLHFAYDPARLADVAAYVVTVTREAYPDLHIPFHSRWRHFQAGGIDRLQQLEQHLAPFSRDERARCHVDLVMTSVLLDAGAGARWSYREADTGAIFSRSEGLAVASWHLFLQGGLSSRPDRPWQADAAGLQDMTDAALAATFQVTSDNPLVGLPGRVTLLRQLGAVAAGAPDYFGATQPRLGNLYDYLCSRVIERVLSAQEILRAVLDSLSPIWPHRLTLGGINLGDVWRHPRVGGNGLTAGLVPLHKLSQWLTYSLIEPLEEAGIRIVDMDSLTGLAEYRNGGLFLDLGVLTPKDEAILRREHEPGSEIIVEWRALTVALLDQVAEPIRAALNVSARALPLAKILEGGTWRAGRRAAAERRPDSSPPLRIASDGTVF